MTLSTGAVSFDDIRTEFGMSGAISYADLYRGGSNIRAKAANNNGVNLAASVPTSGEISIANFQGQARGFRYTFTSGATNQNASTLFGDDYAVNIPKEIVINSGVELGATSASEEALEVPSGGAGTITITNNGTLSGAGGAAGAAGGDAFETAVACTLINNGIIRAGGGGGGAGGAGGNGSYTSNNSSTQYNGNTYRWLTLADSGGTFNQQKAQWNGTYVRGSQYTWTNTTSTTVTIGIYTYTRSGYQQTQYTPEALQYWGINQSYQSTTNTSGGSGGAGGVGAGYNQSAASGSSGVAGGTNAGTGGTGGTGGDFGSSGSTGGTGTNGNSSNGSSGSSGGAAGNYIRGISLVSLTQSGTVQGGTA